MGKLNIAVIFGGTNTEHEVSIITALQTIHALIEAGYKVTPVYISKQSQWLTGDAKFFKPQFYQNLNTPLNQGRLLTINPNQKPYLYTQSAFGRQQALNSIDAVFPVFHGKFGEDGTVQGLIRLLNLPLIGSSVTAAAVGINKHLTKAVVNSLGFPTAPGLHVSKRDWLNHKPDILKKLSRLGKHLIVKPNFSGSSIGVKKVKNKHELTEAVEVGLIYDQSVLVEKALENFIEVNISVLGNDPYEFSATEQLLTGNETLTYEDKYVQGQKTGTKSAGMASAKRLIPAPVSHQNLAQIQKISASLYSLIGGRGLARADFFVQNSQVIFNEINIIPGSLAFYLWAKSGLTFPRLVSRLVDLGLQEYQSQDKLVKTFKSNILQNLTFSGTKTQA